MHDPDIAPEVRRVLHEDLPVAGQLRVRRPALYHRVELAVEVQPRRQGLRLAPAVTIQYFRYLYNARCAVPHLLARCLLALAPILPIVFTVVLQSLVLCLRRDLNLQVNVG